MSKEFQILCWLCLQENFIINFSFRSISVLITPHNELLVNINHEIGSKFHSWYESG